MSNQNPWSPTPPGPPANPYGSDLLVTFGPNGAGDVDATGVLVTGIGVLAQAAVLAQTTPTGSLIVAPNECIDIRQLISKGMTQAQITNLGAVVKAVLQRDQRIISASVTASWNNATSTLTLVEVIRPSAGPTFTLTLTISQVQVSYIYQAQS
jgi:hypothetical protein